MINSIFLKNSKPVFYLTILFFSFFVGFRADSVGADTWNYIDIYRGIGMNGYRGYPEPLYGLLCQYFYLFGYSFSWFQTILTFITLSLGGYTICKHSSNILFSLFCLFGMYFICYAMNITRQIEACFLLLFAYHFLLIGKRVIFILIVLIATGFHSASICMLFLLCIHKLPLNNKIIYLGVLFSFLIGLYLNIELFTFFVGKYAGYLEKSGGSGVRTAERLSYAVALAIYWIVGFLFIWCTAKKEIKNSLYMKLNFIAVLINDITMQLELGIRIVLLFSIMQIILYPLYIKSSILSSSVATFLIICYLSVFFFTFIGTNSANVVPYMITDF